MKKGLMVGMVLGLATTAYAAVVVWDTATIWPRSSGSAQRTCQGTVPPKSYMPGSGKAEVYIGSTAFGGISIVSQGEFTDPATGLKGYKATAMNRSWLLAGSLTVYVTCQ